MARDDSTVIAGSASTQGTEPVADDNPNRELRFGLVVAAIFFVLFLGWAALAPMDSAAFAHGQLVVSGQKQTVQHRDGGVVAAIHVREGQKVRQGEVLIELVGAEVAAQEHALAGQLINLQAQRARLEAEQSGSSSIAWPNDFGVADANPTDVAKAIQVQEAEFRARRSLLNAQFGVLNEQTKQAHENASGFNSKMISSEEQERLIDEELNSLREVAAKGFVAMNRIRALERAKAELHGNRGQYQANVAQARSEAGANRLRQLEAEKGYRERASGELREVELALAEIMPKYRAAYEQAQRLKVRAPVSGTVLALNVFTVGGVIAPGQAVMDIVPDRAQLVVGARVSLDDADDVQPGQEAQIRFVSLHDRSLPIVNGRVTRISADSLADEKTGQVYYTAEVVAPADELNKLNAARSGAAQLRPGTPVQVLVPLKKRTALQYMLEPLSATVWQALREQ